MAGELTAKPVCADCGSQSIAGAFKGEPYCMSCLEPRTQCGWKTVEEAVGVIERLAQAALEAPRESLESIRRQMGEARKNSEMAKEVFEKLRPSLAAGDAGQRMIAPVFGDFVMQDKLGDLLPDLLGPEILLAGWAYGDGPGSVKPCLDSETMLDLIERAMQDPETMYAVFEAFHGQLPQFPRDEGMPFWENVQAGLRQLLAEPWRSRLASVGVVPVFAGLARMSELSAQLVDAGLFPPAPFTERERQLYLEVEGPNRRRAHRAWHFLSELANGELVTREDRAERMVHCWFIARLSWPVTRYLDLLRRSFVAGHYPETIVLCRAVVEGAVNRAIPLNETIPYARPGRDPSMADKLKHLVKMGRLPRSLERKALDVWVRGNKAIHEDPGMYKDPDVVYATIQSAIEVAIALEKFAVETDPE